MLEMRIGVGHKPRRGFAIPSVILVCMAAEVSRAEVILHYRLEGTPGTPATTIVEEINSRGGSILQNEAGAGDAPYVADDPGSGATSISFTNHRFAPSASVPELGSLSDVTVEVILKPHSILGNPFIVSNWPIGDWQFALTLSEQFGTPGHIGGAYSDGVNTFPDYDAVEDPSQAIVDQWYHAALIRDTTADEVRLYVNGTLVSFEPIDFGLSGDDSGFAIGSRCCNGSGGWQPFDGLIAEVRISNNALTPEEFLCHEGVVCNSDVPAVSDWGLAVVVLLILSAGTLVLRGRVGSPLPG